MVKTDSGSRMLPMPSLPLPFRVNKGSVIRLGVVDLVAQFAAFRLQQRSFGVDGDRVGGSSHFKGRVGAGSLGHLNSDARPDILLESRGGHRELIRARRQIGEREIARPGAACRIRLAGGGVLRLDGGVGDNCACRVQNRACNGAAIGLRKRDGSEKQYANRRNQCSHELYPLNLKI